MTKDIPPPLEALKGSALNSLVDRIMRDGVNSTAPKPELMRQFSELVYVNKMMEEGEVRMSMDERTALWKMMRVLKEAIQKAPQDEVHTLTDQFREKFGEDRLESLGAWEKSLLEERPGFNHDKI